MSRDDKTQISLLLAPEQKAEWNQYVEESHEFNSTSQLIRRAVSQYVAADGDVGGTTVTGDDRGEQHGPEILEEMAQLRNGHSKILERLDLFMDEVRSAPTRSTYTDDVFEALPTDADTAMTFEEITRQATGDTVASEQIYMILESLVESTGTVKKTDKGTQTRYYKSQ